jgi:hypothetical protein
MEGPEDCLPAGHWDNTVGRGELVDTSHQRETPPTGTAWMSRLEVVRASLIVMLLGGHLHVIDAPHE